jgi:hypothetical protein
MARRAQMHPEGVLLREKFGNDAKPHAWHRGNRVETSTRRAPKTTGDERPRRLEFAFSVTLRSMPCAKTYRDLDDGCADGPEWRTWLGATGRRAGDCADRERTSRLPPGGLAVSRP